MTVPLNNKAVLILRILSDAPRPLRGQDIADLASRQVECSACCGTGEPHGDDTGTHRAYDAPDRHRSGCSACYGRGYRWMDYSTVMQQLSRMHRLGYVRRVPVIDAWGDVIGGAVAWEATGVEPRSDDPLEQAFARPATEPRR